MIRLRAAVPSDIPSFLAIYAPYITDTTYSFEYTVPSLPESGKTVVRTVYGNSPSGADVVLYRIEGGKHSWAKKDIETSEIIWNFFEPYLKKD